jgi:predicted regulator of Ras-like GTPase activity (Roadblock/LC7/MglB family)
VPAGDDVLLVTIADPEVNVGLARLEMLRAVEEVR